MEEILHQLIGSLSHYLQGFTFQVVQDFFHQRYDVKGAPFKLRVGMFHESCFLFSGLSGWNFWGLGDYYLQRSSSRGAKQHHT